MSDRSKYTDTGFRPDDARDGFGDDGGTRVGRPDGASAHQAPHDASEGQTPGQPGTNTEQVTDGIEGSIMSDAAEGSAQQRVRRATEGKDEGDVNPDRPAGHERTTFNL